MLNLVQICYVQATRQEVASLVDALLQRHRVGAGRYRLQPEPAAYIRLLRHGFCCQGQHGRKTTNRIFCIQSGGYLSLVRNHSLAKEAVGALLGDGCH